MVQLSKTYLIVVLLIGLLIGVGIGWVAKPPEVPVGMVAEADYDAAVSERDAAISERDAARSERDKLKSDYDKLKADYDEMAKAGLTGEVKIGCLLGLSGPLAPHMENSEVIVKHTEDEVNEFLKKSGAKWTLKIVIEDTEGKPDVCLAKLESLAARGMTITIGQATSGEVRNFKGYSDANRILHVGTGSTAPELAIPDYIFRYAPPDTTAGKAVARLLYDDGIRCMIGMWRGDVWADGVIGATRKVFEELGGTYIEGIRFDPEAKEFSAEVKALADIVTSAVETYGADKVGVNWCGWKEILSVGREARLYDILWDVKWYGTSGTFPGIGIIEDPEVAEFAYKTGLNCIMCAPTKSPIYEKVVNWVQTELGRMPNPYSVATYDTIWVVVYSLLAVDKYDVEAVRAVIPDVTRSLFLATGWTFLDENGDKAASNYDIWYVYFEDGEYKWDIAGVYTYTTDSISWLRERA